MSTAAHLRRWHTLWFAARINVYALSLTALWTPMNAVLIQERVSQTVPEALRGSAVGLISLLGIGLAALIQPFAGRLSDLAPLPDRRRPFIVGGTIVDLIFLLALGWAPDFVWLLAAYVMLQISSNVAQAAFQALIPDLVDRPSLGLASGVKNGFDVLGGALGLVGVGLLLGGGTGRAFLFIALALGLGAALTVAWVPPVPPLPAPWRAAGLADLIRQVVTTRAFLVDLRGHRAFARAMAIRFLFLLGLYPVQRFLFFFLHDRFGIVNVARQTSIFALGALLLGAVGAVVAGTLSDRLGRFGMLRLSIAMTAIGVLGTAFSPSLFILAVTGSLLALGSGAFQAVNWALLGEDIPTGRGAQFYGLANIATAGASALAGLFGPIVDLGNYYLPSTGYLIAFALASLFTLASLVLASAE